MSEFVLTPAERAFLAALSDVGVPWLIVSMGAALLEGADGTTQDLDVWLDTFDSAALHEAATRAGGFHNVGFGLHPPMLGGDGLDRLDLVATAQGLRPFADEYATALATEQDGQRVRFLPLERVIAGKRADRRPKDLAQLPLLEAALASKKAR